MEREAKTGLDGAKVGDLVVVERELGPVFAEFLKVVKCDKLSVTLFGGSRWKRSWGRAWGERGWSRFGPRAYLVVDEALVRADAAARATELELKRRRNGITQRVGSKAQELTLEQISAIEDILDGARD